MAIAPVSVSTPQWNNSGQSLNVNMPSGIVAGNLLVVIIHATGTMSTPAGWNLKFQALAPGTQSSVFWRWATGSEAASYTFSTSALSTVFAAVAVQLSGTIGSGDPFDVVVTANQGGSLNSGSCTLVTTVPNCYLLNRDSTGIGSITWSSGPSGMTLLSPNSSAVHVFGGIQAAAGNTGAKVSTYTATSNHQTCMVAIKPAIDATVAPPAAIAMASGSTPDVAASSALAAPSAVALAQGVEPQVSLGSSPQPPAAVARAIPPEPSVAAHVFVPAPAARATVAPLPPEVSLGASIETSPGQATVTAVGQSPGVTAESTIDVLPGAARASAPAPTVTAEASLVSPPAALARVYPVAPDVSADALLDVPAATARAFAADPQVTAGALVQAAEAVAYAMAFPPIYIGAPPAIPQHGEAILADNTAAATLADNTAAAELKTNTAEAYLV